MKNKIRQIQVTTPKIYKLPALAPSSKNADAWFSFQTKSLYAGVSDPFLSTRKILICKLLERVGDPEIARSSLVFSRCATKN